MAEIVKVQPGIVRAREGKASATYYTDSRRIVVVADSGHFADALAAVTALRDEVC